VVLGGAVVSRPYCLADVDEGCARLAGRMATFRANQRRQRQISGGAYFVDVGNDAQSFFRHRLDKPSDEAARRALRRLVRNNVWPTPVTGRLYRWDDAADAPASQPILTVETP
jgi:hypothetical protein